MNLSKSKYCNAVQCMKMLWLLENKPEEKEDANNESQLESGIEVGQYAKKLFGDYIDIEFNQDLKKMVESTEKTIQDNPKCNITEASFVYKNNFCSIDILRKNNQDYEIYEVKSAAKIKDIYIDDVAYQYYILSRLGYNVVKANIVYVNNKYTRCGDLDINKLFNIEDITKDVENKLEKVDKKIKDITNYLKQAEEPTDSIGLFCYDPYDCPFFSYCTRNIEKPNVFDVMIMNKKQKINLYNKGKYSFKDLLDEDINWKYKEQVDFEYNNREPKIEINEIIKFLDTLSYPLYFLDFETYSQIIPLYDDIKPYDKIPFQYSLHYINKKSGEVYHKEFLAQPDIDPRRDLAERLVEDIPKDVCVLAYNMSFEKAVINRLAELYPDLSNHLLNIKDNLKDLMIPFIKRNYYTKEMQGSYSIKYVLPALFPDDPSLNYHNLEDVHNGVEAMDTYATLGKLPKEEQEKLRKNLLKYCELDTLAMVKIYQKLEEVTNDKVLIKK